MIIMHWGTLAFDQCWYYLEIPAGAAASVLNEIISTVGVLTLSDVSDTASAETSAEQRKRFD